MINLQLVKQALEALRQGSPYAALECLDSFVGQHAFEMSDEAILNAAWHLEKEKYQKDVDDAADTVFSDWKEGNFDSSDDLAKTLDDQAGMSSYSDAQRTLLHSGNAEAAMEEHGDFDWRNDIPWCALAFYAFRADVIDVLQSDKGININDTPPKEPSEKCDCCDKWKPKEGFKDENCADCADYQNPQP